MYIFPSLSKNLKKKRDKVYINSITGTQSQLTYVSLEPGETTCHIHPNEQIGYVISGKIEIIIDSKKYICQSGDGFCIPSNIEHGFKVISKKNATYIEIFCPPKKENIL